MSVCPTTSHLYVIFLLNIKCSTGPSSITGIMTNLKKSGYSALLRDLSGRPFFFHAWETGIWLHELHVSNPVPLVSIHRMNEIDSLPPTWCLSLLKVRVFPPWRPERSKQYHIRTNTLDSLPPRPVRARLLFLINGITKFSHIC